LAVPMVPISVRKLERCSNGRSRFRYAFENCLGLAI
jgi:hypothetical protein